MDKKVVGVTGASGMIGRVVVEKLKKMNFEVRDTRIEVSEGRQVKKFMKGCDYIIHLAVQMNMSDSKDKFVRTNVSGVQNILDNAKNIKVVMVSSVVALMYPDGATGNYYVDTKVEGLNLIRNSKNKVVTVMPSIVINHNMLTKQDGPRGAWWMKWLWNNLGGGIPGGIMCAIGNKNRIINFVDIEDVADGIILAMKNGRLGEEYIMGGGNLRATEYLKKISHLMNKNYLRIRIPFFLANLVNVWMKRKIILNPVDMNFSSAKAISEIGYKIRWRL